MIELLYAPTMGYPSCTVS